MKLLSFYNLLIFQFHAVLYNTIFYFFCLLRLWVVPLDFSLSHWSSSVFVASLPKCLECLEQMGKSCTRGNLSRWKITFVTYENSPDEACWYKPAFGRLFQSGVSSIFVTFVLLSSKSHSLWYSVRYHGCHCFLQPFSASDWLPPLVVSMCFFWCSRFWAVVVLVNTPTSSASVTVFWCSSWRHSSFGAALCCRSVFGPGRVDRLGVSCLETLQLQKLRRLVCLPGKLQLIIRCFRFTAGRFGFQINQKNTDMNY